MNSIWNENMALFRKRFPELCVMLASDIAAFEAEPSVSMPFSVEPSRNGAPTAVENAVPLHSKYNPEREALQQLSQFSTENHEAAAFFSFGLGYVPAAFARQFPDIPMILVEPDSRYLFAAFSAFDWKPVLEHAKVIFAIQAPVELTGDLLRQYRSSSLCIFATPAQIAHAKDFYSSVTDILRRNRQKEEVNTNTLEKFAHLWLSNSCRNLHYLGELDGIEKFRMAVRTSGKPLPFIVLAAGPSLSCILPHLAELKKRAVIVCVDTAVHSCLSAGVEPDFIVLVDPQYACAMHLEFLSSPSSILITESAAWPSVFRFPCKETVLCASLFPIGQYFEKQLGSKGKLGAGGSVTTTSWDFARICGATEIYIAGMDLGFPGRQTHIRGSQFEERAHRISDRTHTAENSNIDALMGAYPSIAKDYDGNDILTDRRMSLFSWWFETNCTQSFAQGITTYTLTPQSLAIKGIQKASVEKLLSRPDATEAKEAFFAQAQQNASQIRRTLQENNAPSYQTVLESFRKNMEFLYSLAKKGIRLCDKALKDRLKAPQIFPELTQIDRQILHADAKEAAALVFPTERRLKELSADLPQEPQAQSLQFSRLIYRELLSAVSEYLDKL